jgi:hypothetical protein
MQYFLCDLTVFAAVGTCLPSYSLAEAVSSGSTNMASWDKFGSCWTWHFLCGLGHVSYSICSKRK